MKKIFLISFVLFISLAATAQIAVGPKVGLSVSKMQVDELFDNDGEAISYEAEGNKAGFHIGAFARIMISSFYLQPEVLFTSAGGKIEIDSDLQGSEIRDMTYNKLDIPLLFGYKAGNFFRLQAGPVFSLMLSDDARNISIIEETRQNFNSSTWGYQAGIGFDFGEKVYLDLKYEGNLSGLGSTINIGNQEFETDLRSSLFSVTLGFNLL